MKLISLRSDIQIIIQEIDRVPSPSVSPSAETQAAGITGITNRDFSNNVENETSPTDEDDDEFDLYPDVLELPPLRSPRGSINSLYGSRHGSRHGSIVLELPSGSRHGSRQGSRQGSNCSQASQVPELKLHIVTNNQVTRHNSLIAGFYAL